MNENNESKPQPTPNANATAKPTPLPQPPQSEGSSGGNSPSKAERQAVVMQPTTVAKPEPESERAWRATDDAYVEMQMRRMSRRSFLWGAAAIVAGYSGLKWLNGQYPIDGIPWPFRRVLEVNEGLARGYFQGYRLAPTFDRAQAKEPRANGDEGLSEDFDPAAWTLKVYGLADMSSATPATQAASATPATPETGSAEGDTAMQEASPGEMVLTLTIEDIKKLPKFEMVTEFKCVEGWSEIVHWGGARFADFMALHPPMTRSGNKPDLKKGLQDLVGYVSLETPDGGYYVGLDIESALHPQTLLCYEMNGKPLTLEHGAPLRLVIPVKYGIKNIKRIGTIRFTDRRPADYWAERGYDWYAGH